MISDLQETIFVPTLGDEIIRGTFSLNAPPFSSICFKNKADADGYIDYCKENYPNSVYRLIEYKVVKPAQE